MTRITKVKVPYHAYKDRTRCYICNKTLEFPHVYRVGTSCKFFNKYCCEDCLEHKVFLDLDDEEQLMTYILVQPDGTKITISEEI